MTKCNNLFKNKLINKSTKNCAKIKTKLNDNNLFSRYVLRTMKNIKNDVYLPVKEVYSKYKNGFLKNLTGLEEKQKRNCITCSKTMLKYGSKLKSCENVQKYKIDLIKKKKKPIFNIEKTSKINNLKNNTNEIQSIINKKQTIKPQKKEINVNKIVKFKPSTKVEFNSLDPPLNIMKPSKFDVDKSKFSKTSINTELSTLNQIKDYTHNKKKKKLLKNKNFTSMSNDENKLDAYKNYIISETPFNDDELYNLDPINENKNWGNKKPKKDLKYLDIAAEVDNNIEDVE